MANAELVSLTLPPALLERGFWIYFWKIVLANGDTAHYVGMTGDTGSYKAGSPLKRLGDQLGSNDNSNALRKYLEKEGSPPERCRAFELIAYGPIGEVPADQKGYKAARGKIAALEKALCGALRAAHYAVLHDDPRCNFEFDAEHWDKLKKSFSSHFPLLRVEMLRT